MAHAPLSPSKAHRWMACPGSIREEAAYPDEPSGPAAVDGTHSHTLLERCVKAGLNDPLLSVGITLKDHEGEFVVDRDRAVRVKVAIDYIKSRVEALGGPDQCTVIAEKRVNQHRLLGRSDMAGTADVQIHAPGVLEVIDYKDGMGIVNVEGNPQLELYALGCLAEVNKPEGIDYPYKHVRMTVIQPKLVVKGLQAISYTEKPLSYILTLAQSYIDGAAATDDPNAPLVAGDHCKYCKHKACDTRASNVMKEVGLMFNPVPVDPAPLTVTDDQGSLDLAFQAANQSPATLTPERLREIIEAAPLLRQMLEAAEEEAQRRLEAGQDVPGVKLVNGRGSQAWNIPEDQVAEKLVRMGIPKSAVYVTKVVSPAQVKKLSWQATKAGETVTRTLSERQIKTIENEYITKLAGKLTLALESDPRPAVTRNAAPLFSAVPEPVAAPAVEAPAGLPDWLS